jgi:hypothetical protein
MLNSNNRHPPSLGKTGVHHGCYRDHYHQNSATETTVAETIVTKTLSAVYQQSRSKPGRHRN